MKPYKAEPVIVERLWGGRRLHQYNKKLTEGNIGESWETGEITAGAPILVKLIDAREVLSVQVHPCDEFARLIEKESNGKNEAWIILDCEDEASIIYGFKAPITKEELRKSIDGESFSKLLNYVKVKKGDCIFIPAGTVHSLGKGILAYEVQQPSNLTYRLYDWDRTDEEGKKRELHLEKAMEAIDYSGKLPYVMNIYDTLTDDFLNIIECDHFLSSFGLLEKGKCREHEAGKYMVLTVISGSIVLHHNDTVIIAAKGETCIVPQECDGVIRIESIETSEYIISTSKS